MQVCLMIEGQEDVTWDQWVALAATCERVGIPTLFRSDHYVSVVGRKERGSLDAWATICGLAARTDRLRVGTLVSPATFRHPSILAKNVVTADHISGGRVELGMGAGWHEPEHAAYGFDFPDTGDRMDRFAEQIEIVHRQWTENGFSFAGRHYKLEDVDALPKPIQQPHPHLIVGGSGGRRSIGLTARWADEYNTLTTWTHEIEERRARLDRACEIQGRDPSSLPLSVMTRAVVGADRGEVLRRAAAVLEQTGRGGDPEEYVENQGDAAAVGTLDEVTERLRELEEAGVERVMLQHLAHDDLDTVALIGGELSPLVA